MIDWKKVTEYAENGSPKPPRRVEKSEEEWKQELSPDTFRITRQQGTERPFSGEYCESHAPGRYACACCGTELFESDGKFASRSGWPSFSRPVADNVIRYKEDHSHGMQRIEVLCGVCDAHLGHVFPDGPESTGLRYCINSAALSLKEED